MGCDGRQERLREFRERCERYLRSGYDRWAAARFVAGAVDPLGGTALDVGTGKGVLAVELARRGLEVVSVDPDPAARVIAVDVAEDAGVGKRIDFVTGDGARLPFPTGRFGCAAMLDVLHHLDAPEPILLEMCRVVRPGGRIVVAEFDGAGFEVVARVLRADGAEHGRSAATLDSAAAALEGLGCRLVERVNGHLHDVAVLARGPAGWEG